MNSLLMEMENNINLKSEIHLKQSIID